MFFFPQIFIGLKFRVLHRVFPKKGQPDKKKPMNDGNDGAHSCVGLQQYNNSDGGNDLSDCPQPFCGNDGNGRTYF